MKKYRVVIIGFAHMHINDVARSFFDCPSMDIVACADTPCPDAKALASPYTRNWNKSFCVKQFHIPRVYEDYCTMLDQEHPDLAIVTCENSLHLPVVRECARRGISVSVEKPMATSYSAAFEMARSVQENGVHLMINWPIAWEPVYLKMKSMAEQGAIGRILQMRIRTSHAGPLGTGVRHKGVSEVARPLTGEEKGMTWWHQERKGGGAMLDFCSYGSLLSRWFIGKDAVEVMGMAANLNSTYGDANDNAAMLVRYPDALATIEGSWTSPHEFYPCDFPVLYGTSGIMTIERDKGVKVLLNAETSPRVYTADAPLEGYSIAYAWQHKLQTGSAPFELLDIPLNIAAMQILDAGVRSAKSGRAEPLDASALREVVAE